MNGRIDFTGYTPCTSVAEQDIKKIEAVLSTVGSGLWGAPGDSKLRAVALDRLPQYRLYLEERLEPRGISSLALVDWSALRDACALLEGDLELLDDPFVALANLSAVAGAVIFHDRLVVLDHGDIAERANKLLGVNGLVRGLQLSDEGPGLQLAGILDRHYSWAWHELGMATDQNAPWLEWLQAAWAELLPRATFPNHASAAIESELGYNTSPQRESFKEALFGVYRGARVVGKNTDALILDNDIRALIYERLAQSLDTALAQDQDGPAVTYIGGCLRSPMLLARARWADESLHVTTQPEAFLQRLWAQQWTADRRDIRLPFWMTAVVASANTTSEVADRLRTLRQTARRARVRRKELAESLRRGDSAVNRQLFQALAADLEGLPGDWESVAGTALELGSVVLQSAAPGLPKELIKPALKGGTILGDSWLRTLAVRLFRPRAYAVYRMAADARALTDVLGTASRLFAFPEAC